MKKILNILFGVIILITTSCCIVEPQPIDESYLIALKNIRINRTDDSLFFIKDTLINNKRVYSILSTYKLDTISNHKVIPYKQKDTIYSDDMYDFNYKLCYSYTKNYELIIYKFKTSNIIKAYSVKLQVDTNTNVSLQKFILAY